MRNLSIINALILILILLAGCSMPPHAGETEKETAASATATPVSVEETAVPEEEIIMPAEEVTVPEETGDAFYAELGELLDMVRDRYYPGTAGSSLSAAACAAELADFFAESSMSPDTVDRVVQDYYAFLPQEDAELFETQLDGIVGAFSSLAGENGEGLLDDCGYAALHFPWNEENIRDCFAALLGSD